MINKIKEFFSRKRRANEMVKKYKLSERFGIEQEVKS